MIRFGAPTVADAVHVALHMREDERAQWCAMTGRADYDANAAAAGLVALGGLKWCMYDDADGLPRVLGGLDPVRPGVAEAWLACTAEGWAAHWKPLTTFCRQTVNALLREGTLRRVEVVALAGRTAAQAWYARALGLRAEGVLASYFANGEDGVLHAKTRKHLETRR